MSASLKIDTSTFFVLFFISINLSHCSNPYEDKLGHVKKTMLSFKKVEGITFIEVDRRLKSGLAYNEFGYHLAPEWKLRFVSADSAALYSPVKKKFLNFPLSLGTDSIFNTARVFLKMQKMSKDSLLFDLLEPKNDSMNINGARVTMLLYSKGYLKAKLKRDSLFLKRATRRDSLFITALAKKANADFTKFFAAQQPVQLIPKNRLIAVTKQKVKASYLENNFNTSDDYMNPTCDITIYKAYQDFNDHFSVYVDNKGVMHYHTALTVFFGDKEAEANYIKVTTAIMNTYLKLYLTTIPGETLGIKHATNITLNVVGIAHAQAKGK